MKTKKLLLITIAITVFLTFFSCGTKNCEHSDIDGDKVCDVCKEYLSDERINDVSLIKDGKALFQVVLGQNISNEAIRSANANISALLRNEYNISVTTVTEGSQKDNEQEVEILVGDVSSRGPKYQIDGYVLGDDDCIIKIVDSKILINAGSDKKLDDTLKLFANTILSRADDGDVVMTVNDITVSINNNYTISSLSLLSEDMRDYTIATDLASENYSNAAVNFQKSLFLNSGYFLDIVDLSEATEKSVIIRHKYAQGSESFKVSTEGKRLMVDCAYDNMLQVAMDRFVQKTIAESNGSVNFEGTVYTQDISVIYYEDFGAKGDGATDDFKAMYDAHVVANKGGQTVLGKPGAAYYVCNTRIKENGVEKPTAIPIRTNTDWQGAKIVIDDTNIASFSGGQNYDLSSYHIFSILPNDEHKGFKFMDNEQLSAIVSDGLNPDTKHINLKIDGWDGAMMLIPTNSDHKVFRRRGYSQHSGEAMSELIIIDKDGNVSEETPIMFEYTNLNYITVYRLDPSSAISVGNAVIETLDTRINHKDPKTSKYDSTYRRRGISVSRSYTTVHNIEHIVSGGFNLLERSNGYEGAMSNGMFRASNANQVTFKDCIIPGRQSYSGHSSYNFGAKYVNKIVLDGCIQSNFWVTVDKATGIMTPHTDYVAGALPSVSTVKVNGVSIMMHWGIGGTNYCKNMEYIDSQISRFDAHAGLYNGKIINTKINGMELTGVGELVIENVDWYQYGTTVPLLFLRSDYGYHWDGDILIKNTNAYLYDLGTSKPTLYLANHKYTNWYFGYTCAFPNITLDNFGVYSTKTNTPMSEGYEVHLFNFKETAEKMHLSDNTNSKSIFDYVDDDSDGYIDEPLYDVNLDGRIDDSDRIDVDGDGRVGNTSLKKSDYSFSESGVSHPQCKRNLNITKPPRYFKVINNNGGYVYRIVDTSLAGISDGGWYRDKDSEDTLGGFFGNTKFIYGEGADNYFVGTSHSDQTITKSFKFSDSFY